MKYRLLIADDEAVEREALEFLANQLFPDMFEIRTAENGRRAVEIANEFAPSIAMMDIKMPLLNGIDASRQILELFPDCKIVMLTGFTYFNYARESVSLGAVEFLVKPASDEMVESALKSAMAAADKACSRKPDNIRQTDTAGGEEKLRESERQLCRLLEKRDFDSAAALMDSMLTDIAKHAERANVMIYELLVVINRRAEEWVQVSSTYPFLSQIENLESDLQRREYAMAYLKKVTDKLIALDVQQSQSWEDELMRIMNTEYAKGLTLENVAGRMGFSTYYFSRIFKQKYDKSFVEYLTDIRIRKAMELLSEPDASVKDVCFSVGYSEPNYFARVFKRETGVSPSAYRRKNSGVRN